MSSDQSESLKLEVSLPTRSKSGVLSSAVKSPTGASVLFTRGFSFGRRGPPNNLMDSSYCASASEATTHSVMAGKGNNRRLSLQESSPSEILRQLQASGGDRRQSFANFLSDMPVEPDPADNLSAATKKENHSHKFSGTFSDTWKRSTAEHLNMLKSSQRDGKEDAVPSESFLDMIQEREVMLPDRKTRRWRLQRKNLVRELPSEPIPLISEEENFVGLPSNESSTSPSFPEEDDFDPGWCIDFCIVSKSGNSVFRRKFVWFLMAFWIVLGLCLAALAFFLLYRGLTWQRTNSVALACEIFASKIEAQLVEEVNNIKDLSEVLSTYYYPSNNISEASDQFTSYINSTQADRITSQGLIYAERVTARRRPAFELLIHGCILSSPDPHAPPFCSLNQSEYASILFEALNSSLGQLNLSLPLAFPRGLDLFSVALLTDPLTRARDLGVSPALTAPFQRLDISPYVYLAQVFPVYLDGFTPTSNLSVEQNRSVTQGYFVNVFNFTDNMEYIYTQKLSLVEPIVGVVQDVTEADSPVLMWKSSLVSSVAQQFSDAIPMSFGDPARSYTLYCSHYPDGWFPWPSVYWPAAILVTTVIIALAVDSAVKGLQRMGRDYQRMKELKEKMAEAKLAAESASRAKGAFLATMSHEIRTPMNGVIGMLNLLLDTGLDATQLDYVETARSSGRALCALINDVLDLSKIESGRLELERIPFSLGSEIDDVLSMFAEKAREKVSIELASLVQEGVPRRLLGDPLRFRQVLINLIGNAFKFTKKGHIFVVARLAFPHEVLSMQEAYGEKGPMAAPHPPSIPTPAPPSPLVRNFLTLSGRQAAQSCNSWRRVGHIMNQGAAALHSKGDLVRLVISCEDTGVGIPAWARPSIFKPFTQADTSTTRTHGGTGIGLTICHRLVEMMGGSISFESELSVGTTFFFDCTMEVADGATPSAGGALTPGTSHEYPVGLKPFAAPPQAPAHASPTRSVLFSALREDAQHALVVDRRPVRRAVIGWHLRRLGLHVDHCSSAEDARAILCGSSSSTAALEASTSSSPDPSSPLSAGSSQAQSPRRRREYCAVFVDEEEAGQAGDGRDSEEQRMARCAALCRGGSQRSGSGLGAAAGSSASASSGPKGQAPVVVLLRERRLEEVARRAGFDTVLLKPLRRGSVSACLVQLFSGVGLARTSSGGIVARHLPRSSAPPSTEASLANTNGAAVPNLRQEKVPGAEVPLQDKEGHGATLRSLFAGKRVLVVDDNLVNRKVISRMLQRYGASAEQVDSGFKAIERFREGQRFDLVFMDVQMPLMDGYEATKEIRMLEMSVDPSGQLHAPIFALTADIVVGTREKCTDSGMDGFLSKPIEDDQLVRVLHPFFLAAEQK